MKQKQWEQLKSKVFFELNYQDQQVFINTQNCPRQNIFKVRRHQIMSENVQKEQLILRFKKAYPKWEFLSWQKKSEIGRDIRNIQSFRILVEICQEKLLRNYPFNRNLILILEKHFEKNYLHQPKFQNLETIKDECFQFLKSQLLTRIEQKQKQYQLTERLIEQQDNKSQNYEEKPIQKNELSLFSTILKMFYLCIRLPFMCLGQLCSFFWQLIKIFFQARQN